MSDTTESTDRVAAFLDDARKRWEAFGEGDVTPRLLGAVERVLELRQPYERMTTRFCSSCVNGGHRVEWPCPTCKAIAQELLGEDGDSG